MHHKARLFIIAILITLLMSACGVRNSPQQVEPKLRLSAGDKFAYLSVTKQQVSMPYFGTIDQQIETIVSYTVLSSDPDGSSQVRMTYEWFAMGMQNGDKNIRITSNDPESEQGNSELCACMGLAGESLTMTVDLDGRITEIEGIDVLVDRTSGDRADELTEKQREQMRQMFQANLGQPASSFSLPLPGRAVAVGDTWHVDQEVNAVFMQLDLGMDFTLREINDQQLTVGLSGTIQPGANTEPVMASGVEMLVDVSGTQIGAAHIDRASGMLLDSTMTQHISGTVSISNTELATTGLNGMSIAVTSTINVQRRDPNAALPTPAPTATVTPTPTPPPAPDNSALLELLDEDLKAELGGNAQVAERHEFDELVFAVLTNGNDPATMRLAAVQSALYEGEWDTAWGYLAEDQADDGAVLMFDTDYFYEEQAPSTVVYGFSRDSRVATVEVSFAGTKAQSEKVSRAGDTFSIVGRDASYVCWVDALDATGSLLERTLVDPRWDSDAAAECDLPQQPTPTPHPFPADEALLPQIRDQLVGWDESIQEPIEIIERHKVADPEGWMTGPAAILLVRDSKTPATLAYATVSQYRGRWSVVEAYSEEPTSPTTATLETYVTYTEPEEDVYITLVYGRSSDARIAQVAVSFDNGTEQREHLSGPDDTYLFTMPDGTTACWIDSYDAAGQRLERLPLFDPDYDYEVEACTGSKDLEQSPITTVTPWVTPTP